MYDIEWEPVERMGVREILAEAAMFILDFEESLGVWHRNKALKGKRKPCIFKSSEIRKSLGLPEVGILMEVGS